MKKIFSILLVFILFVFIVGCEETKNLTDFEKAFGSKYLLVRENEEYYFVNEDGEKIFDQTFEAANPFKNGTAQVNIKFYNHIINEKGEVLTEKYKSATKIIDGRHIAVDKKTNKEILLNKKCEPLFTKKVDRITGVMGDYISVYNNGKAEVYKTSGKCIFSSEGKTIQLLNDGMFVVIESSTNKTLYNNKGKKIMSNLYDVLMIDNKIIVYTDQFNCKVINKQGKQINSGYNISSYNRDVNKFIASKDGVSYVLDLNFNCVAKGTLVPTDSNKYFTTVKVDDKFIAYNNDGQMVVDRPYDKVQHLQNYLLAYDLEENNNSYLDNKTHMYIFDEDGQLIFDTAETKYFQPKPEFKLTNDDIYIKIYEDNKQKYYLIDKVENKLINIPFDNIINISGDFALVKTKVLENGEYEVAIVNIKTNEVVFNTKNMIQIIVYNNQYILCNYSSTVSNGIGNRFGLIDITGKELLEAKYQDIIY